MLIIIIASVFVFSAYLGLFWCVSNYIIMPIECYQQKYKNNNSENIANTSKVPNNVLS